MTSQADRHCPQPTHSSSETSRYDQLGCSTRAEATLTPPAGPSQGKQRGDPDVDMSTVEPAPVLRARLLSFWDDLFSCPPPGRFLSSDPPRQALYVSHGGSIKEFVNGVLDERAGDYAVAPEGFVGNVGESVANCSITRIAMTWDASLPGESEAVRGGGEGCSRARPAGMLGQLGPAF